MPGKPKKKTKEVYVLDAYALLAFLEAEAGGKRVRDLLEDTKNCFYICFYISAVNLGEVYYTILRERGKEAAEKVEAEINQAGNIYVVDATWEMAKAAGEFKARGGISYADCFAAALAMEKNALLVTGDREFERVADKIRIFWIV